MVNGSENCERRKSLHREYVYAMRKCFFEIMINALPKVLAHMIADYYILDEIEHFVAIMSTGLISGSARIENRVCSVRIVSVGDGFAARGRELNLGRPCLHRHVYEHLIQKFDLGLFGETVIGNSFYKLVFPYAINPSLKHLAKFEISTIMYGKYKRAARKLMYRHLREIRANPVQTRCKHGKKYSAA